MGRQKYFFKIYREFGHLSSKRFASPELDYNGRPFKTKAKDKTDGDKVERQQTGVQLTLEWSLLTAL